MTEQPIDQAELAREKHAAAADPHETPDQKLAREKRGHVSTDNNSQGENR